MDYVSLIPLKGGEPFDGCEIGGKAGNLVELVRAGLPVPDGWIVPGEVFEDHLAAHGLGESAHATFTDGDERRCGEVRRSILSMELKPEMLRSFSGLPDAPLAVRSSASVEDGVRGSYSGLFRSCLGVGKADLGHAIRQVWASVFTPEVQSYHRQVAPGSGCPIMAVLIMPTLDTRISGVAFSADPSDGNPFRIAISACRGLGTRIVDGAESGARYVLDLDTLETITASTGRQTKGDFLQPDGRVVIREVHAEVELSEDERRVVGEAVRAIDEVLDARVDVEFAFTDEGLAVLQARSILGLPGFFPDDPRSEQCGTQHTTWSDPLPPLVQEIYSGSMEHESIPRPPWSLEGELFWCVHGRAFGCWRPDPDELDERTFLRDMEAMEDPADYFRGCHAWTERVYESTVPRLRESSTNLLSMSRDELAALAPRRLADLFQKALDLEHQAHVLYVSCTWPTSYYPCITETLLQDWLDFPSLPPRVYSSPGEQLAMELIQGIPTLLHARSSQLQRIAWGEGDLDDFVDQWGYSYIVRDEQLYLHRWKGWKEDSRPLLWAMEQMRRAADRTPLSEKLEASRRRADERLSRTVDDLRTRFPKDYERRSRILTACVDFGRAHFRMKDDRDLIWSHAQAALRWVLSEMTRRLVKAGALGSDGDVFLLRSEELIGFLVGKRPTPSEASAIVEQRWREQKRLARFSGILQDGGQAPAPPEGGVMIGIPTGTGIAEGKAHIVREATALADLARLEDGDILVFIGEGKVGLTMFFPQIAGLVYSSGNGFSHEVNILRELGKPAIVSLWENALLIREGERLRIDADRGILVRFEERGESRPPVERH